MSPGRRFVLPAVRLTVCGAAIALTSIVVSGLLCKAHDAGPVRPEPVVYRSFQYGAYDCWLVIEDGIEGPAECSQNPPGYPIYEGIPLEELKNASRD